MFKIFLSFLYLYLVACATSFSTPYQKMGERYGHKVFKVDDTYQGSLFKGNSKTNSKKAYHYSRLGALEACYRQNKMTLLVKTIDTSIKSTYTQYTTTNHTVPTYTKYKGKTYSNYSNARTYTNTQSYPVTLKYPNFVTVFRCVDKMVSFKGVLKFEALSKELVSPFTKDFKGGLLVKKVQPESTLKENDAIVSVNGHRLEAQSELNIILSQKIKSLEVEVKLIRDKEFKVIKASLSDLSASVFLENLLEFTKACDQKSDFEPEILFCKEAPPAEWLKKFPQFKNDKKQSKEKLVSIIK